MLSSKKIFTYFLLITIAVSCKEKLSSDELNEIGITPCRKLAPFIKTLGFDGNRSAFSTTQKNTKGIVLIEAPKNVTETNFRIHQDSSWKQFGYLGSITTDNDGNVYTANIPVVNTLEVPVNEMNKVLQIDAKTGKLQVFCELPKPNAKDEIVPFGILGVYFDCHGKKLYVSSVSGSTRDKENGVIYVIDIASKKVVDELKGYDAMGLFVGGTTGEKRLYFGKARNSKVLSVELNKEGLFENKTKIATEVDLDNLGPRGTDKARRIRYDKSGNLLLFGVDFNYSLAAQGDKPETIYQFNFDEVEKKWIFYKILK